MVQHDQRGSHGTWNGRFRRSGGFAQKPRQHRKKAGEEINIQYVLDLREFPDSPLHDRFVKDFPSSKRTQRSRWWWNAWGGLHPAYDFVKACLLAGKSVATSNKELVAEKGAELLRIAKDKNVNFLFEASVGGGIPIIRPLNQCLAANEVYEIAGILNGTTNFILSKMIHEQMSFDDALALAQKLGYAERDPLPTLKGRTLPQNLHSRLARLWKACVSRPGSYRGITKITLEDVEYASNYGGVVKLLGRVKKLDDGLCRDGIPRHRGTLRSARRGGGRV